MLPRASQAAQTSKIEKVFCFFSSEKKTSLPLTATPKLPDTFWQKPRRAGNSFKALRATQESLPARGVCHRKGTGGRLRNLWVRLNTRIS